MSAAHGQNVNQHPKPGPNPGEGQRMHSSSAGRDDEANLQKVEREAAAKRDRHTVNNLEYGWLCGLDTGTTPYHHCTEEDKTIAQPQLNERCSNTNCRLVRTAACLRVRLFSPSHVRLLPLLRGNHHAEDNEDTGWYHRTCRTFRWKYTSAKFCPTCNRIVHANEYEYLCAAY